MDLVVADDPLARSASDHAPINRQASPLDSVPNDCVPIASLDPDPAPSPCDTWQHSAPTHGVPTPGDSGSVAGGEYMADSMVQHATSTEVASVQPTANRPRTRLQENIM
jgi:hypothetical protein